MKREPRALLGCPVHDLASQYDALAAQWTEDDKAGDPEENHFALHDRMQEIIQAASYLTPRSKSGAAFMILAASMQESTIGHGTTPGIRKDAEARLQRLLYRLLEWIELDDDELLNARVHAMPAHLDPREYRG